MSSFDFVVTYLLQKNILEIILKILEFIIFCKIIYFMLPIKHKDKWYV